MGTLNIMKTDGPVAVIDTHMNRMYLLLEQNNTCNRGQDYSTLTITVSACGEDASGDINPDDILNVREFNYRRDQINIRETPEDFPPYNIWIDLKNHWYQVQLYFRFQYPYEHGGATFASKLTYYNVDNRNTTLTNQGTSAYFVGRLKDNMQKKKEFNVYFGLDPIPNADVGDLVIVNGGTIIRQVNAEGNLYPAEKTYLDMIQFILYQDNLSQILINNFGEILPEYVLFTFSILLNGEEYKIHLKGNLQFLVKGGNNGVI